MKKNIQREDGTYLTDEEMENLLKEVEDVSNPIEDYLKIKELEGTLFPTDIGLVEIVKAEQILNNIFFDLRFVDYTFAEKVAYPISKQMDKGNKIFSPRFIAFLNWQVLKNFDSIANNVDMDD